MDDATTAEVMLSGHVDHQAEARLTEALDLLLGIHRVRQIEIDTAMVEFCDRGGLIVFLRAQQQAAKFGVPLRIVRATPMLLHLLESTGLTQLLRSA